MNDGTISDKRGGFTVIENEVFKLGLNPYELAVYVVLLSHVNQQTGVAFPGLERLAILSNMSRKQVQRSLDGLIKRHLISKKSRKNGREYLSNLYEIHPVKGMVQQTIPYGPTDHTLWSNRPYPMVQQTIPMVQQTHEQESLTKRSNQSEGTTVAPAPENVFLETLKKQQRKGKLL